MSRILAALVAPCLLAGQQIAAVSTPRLGYLADEGRHRLRPLAGLAGAALVGEAIGPEFSLAAVAPNQEYALLVSSNRLTVLKLQSLETAFAASLEAPPEAILFSPGGRTAILSTGDPGPVLTVLVGLPEAPVIAKAVAPEGVRPLAISDRGEILAAGDSLWVLSTATAPRIVPVAGAAAAAAFHPQSGDALVAAGGQLILIRNLSTDPDYRILPAPPTVPLAVAFSADVSQAITVTREGRVNAVGIETGQTTTADCPCMPSGLHPTSEASVFRLDELSRGPLHLVDVRGPVLRLWFVPKGVEQ